MSDTIEPWLNNTRFTAASVRRLMKEETMGSIATVFPEDNEHAGTYDNGLACSSFL